MDTLYDMHCHLGFAANAPQAGAIAAAARIGALSCTVGPEEFAAFGTGGAVPDDGAHGEAGPAGRGAANAEGRACSEGAARCETEGPAPDGNSPVTWGLGLHPWYVREDWRPQAEAFEALMPQAGAFGELGLDFSNRHKGSADAQVAAFNWLLQAIASQARRSTAPPLLSLHAVHSADAVLEALRKTGALDCCRVVLHWFSGSGEELAAARQAGCYFSVGPHMLASRRGRAYGAQIPASHLLLETDEPSEGAVLEGAAWRGQLEGALGQLAALRRADAAELGAAIAATSRQLLGLGL